jgi:diaminohydroxyphosphoribosylaminopyrimidine deaminase/5-amino-6-(5-phosphoribosylamino)uracil reductase
MQPPPGETRSDEVWRGLLAHEPGAAALAPLYAPLLAPDGTGFVLGRIAQSLDGRIATSSGLSFWISGEQDVLHTHRLRALFDAVVVGAGTVRADDPLLTTRHCPGPSPARVVIDTERRLGEGYRVFQGGPPSWVLCAEDAPGPDRLGSAQVLRLPRAAPGASLAPSTILAALARLGLHRVFVEGGGITVSRFLASSCLDRLHLTIAPLLLGSGIPSFTLPGVTRPEDGLRVGFTLHRLGADLLLDIPLVRA